MIAIDVLLVAVSLLLLVVGAEVLVRGAVGVALRAGLSSFFVGLTIVGFGTSTPELAAGVVSVWRGVPGLNVGNVLGSNVFNICVVLGVASLIRSVPVGVASVRKEIPFFVASGAVPAVLAWSVGASPRWAGVLMLCVLVWYVVRGYRAGLRGGGGGGEVVLVGSGAEGGVGQSGVELGDVGVSAARGRAVWVSALMIVVGILVLTGGSILLVESASGLARAAGLSELVIGLTVVAAGTSAPELVTSVVAAVRGQSDVSIGNVLGSNVFNVFGILGLTSALEPQLIGGRVAWLDGPVLLLVTLLAVPIMLSGGRIARSEGVLLVCGYAAYAVAVFAVSA